MCLLQNFLVTYLSDLFAGYLQCFRQLTELASNAFIISFGENCHRKCLFPLKLSENQRFFGDFRAMEVY